MGYIKSCSCTSQVLSIFRYNKWLLSIFCTIVQTDPAGNVEKVAENMQLYPPEDYLTGESLMFEYDEELIKECQDVLVPEKASFLLYSKRFEEDGVCTETEPWFNIPYNSAG